jgi:hypothetical protein
MEVNSQIAAPETLLPLKYPLLICDGSHSDLSALLQGTELRVLGRPAVGKLLRPLSSDITLYCRKVKAFNIIDEPE